jgi:hypothetical protein
MTRTQCRAPNCDNQPGQHDSSDYNDSRYCSPYCEVTVEKLRQEASDARRQACMEAERVRGDSVPVRPERDRDE